MPPDPRVEIVERLRPRSLFGQTLPHFVDIGLHPVQRRIAAALVDQLVMRPILHQPAADYPGAKLVAERISQIEIGFVLAKSKSYPLRSTCAFTNARRRLACAYRSYLSNETKRCSR